MMQLLLQGFHNLACSREKRFLRVCYIRMFYQGIEGCLRKDDGGMIEVRLSA